MFSPEKAVDDVSWLCHCGILNIFPEDLKLTSLICSECTAKENLKLKPTKYEECNAPHFRQDCPKFMVSSLFILLVTRCQELFI